VFESLLTVAGFYLASRVLLAMAGRSAFRGGRRRRPAVAAARGGRRLGRDAAGRARVSRAFERSADRFALELTRNPAAFISAMRRLGAQTSPRTIRHHCAGCSTAIRRCASARAAQARSHPAVTRVRPLSPAWLRRRATALSAVGRNRNGEIRHLVRDMALLDADQRRVHHRSTQVLLPSAPPGRSVVEAAMRPRAGMDASFSASQLPHFRFQVHGHMAEDATGIPSQARRGGKIVPI
jgi:hypothetical protein